MAAGLCLSSFVVDGQYESCNGTVTDIGNGRCDAELNVPSCGFDGGDCCSCTCVDGPTHSCSDGDFDCLYPDCGESEDTAVEVECFEDYKGDSYCDPFNNSPRYIPGAEINVNSSFT